MSKRIALKDSVMVDTTDLSDFSRTVRFSSEHNQVDVSGFNATGANEYLMKPFNKDILIAKLRLMDAVPEE